MSELTEDETKDEPTDDSQQSSGQKPSDSDRPSAQSGEQPGEQSDQSTQQSEEQPAARDQPINQTEEQSNGDDHSPEKSQEEPSDSDQAGTSAPADDAEAFGDSPAAAPGKGGGARNVKLIAELTQEGGQKFIGDIKIGVLEYDKQGVSTPKWELQDWQAGSVKGNVITTPLVRLTTPQVAVMVNVRAILANGGYQMMSREFVFTMPSSDTLKAKFDVEVKPLDQTVKATDATQARAIVSQPPLLRGQVVFELDAQPVGNQQFHVTGKYYPGDISSPDGKAL